VTGLYSTKSPVRLSVSPAFQVTYRRVSGPSDRYKLPHSTNLVIRSDMRTPGWRPGFFMASLSSQGRRKGRVLPSGDYRGPNRLAVFVEEGGLQTVARGNVS
jgi:hypothetical protein